MLIPKTRGNSDGLIPIHNFAFIMEPAQQRKDICRNYKLLSCNASGMSSAIEEKLKVNRAETLKPTILDGITNLLLNRYKSFSPDLEVFVDECGENEANEQLVRYLLDRESSIKK